ncbi:MAG: packaged DNA stabilization gp4 family protein [Pseudomonadota bacterium]
MTSWTKQQLVDQAFAEIGLPVEVYNVGPDQMARALNRLDAMMATWYGAGIHVGYALASNPGDSSLAAESGLADITVEAVYLSLAIRLAPGRGKAVSPELRLAASQAYATLEKAAAAPLQQQFRNNLPLGAGNKPWRSNGNPFIPNAVDQLTVTEDGSVIDLDE